jgi:hypothetical protein
VGTPAPIKGRLCGAKRGGNVDYSDVQKSVPVKLARLLLDITIGIFKPSLIHF